MNSLKNMVHPNRTTEPGNEQAGNTTATRPMHNSDNTTHRQEPMNDTAYQQQPMANPTATHHHQHDQHHHAGRDAALAGGAAYEANKHMGHRREGSHATTEETASARSSAEFGGQQGMGVGAMNAAAEEGNNFPGTNPHPAHSALGGQSRVFPGTE